jgi:predicted ATPase
MHTIKPPITINHQSLKFYEDFKTNDLSILCGRNNSGKRFLLRKLYTDFGEKTSYLGPNRYQNFNILGVVSNKRDKSKEYYDWIRNYKQNQQNIDNSPWNLQQAIAELGNLKRDTLFTIINELLGSDIHIKMSDPNNEMSQRFVSVDGYNMSYTSSGFRLIASILTSLLDDDYENFLIDEPELGISPEIQGVLADFLLNDKNRVMHFPHLKKLIIATHSPVFIDKIRTSNNYYVEKLNNDIFINQIQTIQEINSLQFFLLGNRFETLFLPSIIILVEGKCDFKYINQVVKKRYSNHNISIIQCNSDSKISEYIYMAKNMFGDLNKSPYHNRILTIIDKIHQTGLKEKLLKQGIPDENIIIWSNNGIEYYYAEEIMVKIFGQYDELKIQGDIVSANGVEKKKNELVEEVVSILNGKEIHNTEFNNKLLDRLEKLIY